MDIWDCSRNCWLFPTVYFPLLSQEENSHYSCYKSQGVCVGGGGRQEKNDFGIETL